MKIIHFHILIEYILIRGGLFFRYVLSSPSFEMGFQASGIWSSNEWAEFVGPIPALNEFTSCHWEKLAYFATKSSHVWSYCYQNENKRNDMKCIQLYSTGDIDSYNQNVVYALWIIGMGQYGFDIRFRVETFRHRTWNHICVVYSTSKNTAKLYFNGELYEKILPNPLPNIFASKEAIAHSFILGQEPDSLHGNFSSAQAFYGSLAELNVWNTNIEETKIRELAACHLFLKGNVISWEKQNFAWSGIQVSSIEDVKYTFLNKKKKYVIFPQMFMRQGAKRICSLHGGSIVAPESDQENLEVLNVLLKHENACLDESSMDSLSLTGTWMGLDKLDKKWIRINDMTEIKEEAFNRWSGSTWQQDFEGMCGRLLPNGMWQAEQDCDQVLLCVVCEFDYQPVFSFKGLCEKGSQYQWNYYLTTNSSFQIDMYEGYKRHAGVTLEDHQWKSDYNGDQIHLSHGHIPVGRDEWEWKEKRCTNEIMPRNITFSACVVGREFTCDSGHCISLNKRCDNTRDCLDGSDEDECILVNIPESYEKQVPPKGEHGASLPVGIKIFVENINQVDTKNMMIDTSLKLMMDWRDSRLKFRNLKREAHNLINSEISKQLWLPNANLLYLNTIVGQTYEDPKLHVSAYTNSTPLPFDIYRDREEYIYNGSLTKIQTTAVLRIETICEFEFQKFPFDKQRCDYVICLRGTDHRKVHIVANNNSVIYVGGKTVGQFVIDSAIEITQDFEECSTKNGVKFIIKLRRHSFNGIIQIIFPSLILWLCAVLTLRVDIGDLTNRNRTSVTALLVLVTLFGSITNKEDFPKTSGIKYIDLWFLWYLTHIFVIICHHIAISRISIKLENSDGSSTVYPKDAMYGDKEEIIKMMTLKRKKLFNSIMNILLLVSMLAFNIIYFLLVKK